MDFTLTEEQEQLRTAVRDVLARECPPDTVRDVVEERAPVEVLWKQMVALGWPALAIPEDAGGLGYGIIELILIVEELGRAAAPGPFLGTVTQFVPAVLAAANPDQRASLLGGVADGSVTGTLAAASDGRWNPASPPFRAVPDGDGWALTGTATHVVDGDRADELVVAAEAEDGVGLFVVAGEDADADPIETVDETRVLASVTLDGVRVPPDRVLGQPGEAGEALRRILDTATVALSAEMVGTCQAILDLTVGYVGMREQFGRPIGSFQAVKHQLADCYVLLEKARATCYHAAMTLAEDHDDRGLAAAMAKSTAGDAQREIARAGIQLHGGIGYTWEHDVHLFVKRVQAAEPLFGNGPVQRRRVADLLGI